MGIYNALFTGASGLSSFGEAVRVIGDNIANVNSLGFKSQNVVFSDVLSQTVNVSRSNIANQVGNGVRIAQITRDSQQGSIQSTTNATDMAINGRGMFALKDPASGQTFYTRAGAFFLDKSFNLIDGQGFVVQGWKTDTTGAATGNVGDITFANLAAQASASTKVDVGVSIDSNAIKPGSAFNPNDATTYNYKADVNIFDSLGATHAVSTYFVKQGLDANGQTVWDWHTAVAGNELKGANGSTPTTPVEIGGGIYDINTPTVPVGLVWPKNTVLSSTTTTDQTITIPKGAITDQFGTTNIAAVTWTAGTTLGSVVSQAAAGSLSASGLFTLNSVITPSPTYNATNATVAANTTLEVGTVIDPATTFSAPAGGLTVTVTDEAGTAATVTWAANTTMSTAAAAAGLSATGPYHVSTASALGTAAVTVTAGSITPPTVVSDGNIYLPGTGSTTDATTAVANGTLPTLLYARNSTNGTAVDSNGVGATLSADSLTSLGSSTVTFPPGTLQDENGVVNSAAISWIANTKLSTAVTQANATMAAQGVYTVVGTQDITVAAGTTLGAGLVSNPSISATATTGISGVGPQSMVFDANGALVREFSPKLTFPWNGANSSQINFNMGSATTVDAQGTTGGKGLDGVVQMAGSFATRQMTRDGFTSGFLDKLETDSTGVIFGVFTNGQRRPLFQVALASFPNAQVLSHVGNNLQQETIASGAPVMEKPSNGGMGSISPFGLEQSNVDLAGEFVKLIVVQRGYEANSKTITTTDQMMGSLMRLKH
ncbi:MAG: flagellar hook-basal body complex protein [Mariprofundales bacterium]